MLELKAEDFQQSAYYMTEQGGRFVIIVFRGEIKNHYYQHVKRISLAGGLILMLNDKDLLVFIRQSINGKVKDAHLQDKFDTVIRKIS